jgi:hypothetical protein
MLFYSYLLLYLLTQVIRKHIPIHLCKLLVAMCSFIVYKMLNKELILIKNKELILIKKRIYELMGFEIS